MSRGILTYTGELTVMVCWCGTRHGVPTEMYEHQRRAHDNGREVPNIYCPLGHAHIPAGKSKVAVEREAREHAERAAANAAEEARIAHAEVKRLKAAATRQAKRAAAGVCPCCNRSFVQLARHMKTKHPDAT